MTAPDTEAGPISLRAFFMRLAVDPMALADFLRDPLAVVERFALDEPGRAVLAQNAERQMWDLLLRRPAAGPQAHGTGPAARGTGPEANGTGKSEAAAPRGGSLAVVGTGIRTVGQLTTEAIAWIKESDAVLYLVADPIAEEVIRGLNPAGAMSLRGYYGEGVVRSLSYEAMVQHIVGCVRTGQRTCVALYGHPGVFAYPAHEAIRRLRAEGFPCRMLPGVSAEDCLFADLGVDPAQTGCQSFEASDFVLSARTIDVTASLILWQVGVVGDNTYRAGGYNLDAFPVMISKLTSLFGGSHVATVYEAAMLPGQAARIRPIAIDSLSTSDVTAGSTLYVPPSQRKEVDYELARRLGFVK